MEPISPKNYEMDQHWPVWCRLPSFASIRKYQTMLAQFHHAGGIQFEQQDPIAHTCGLCLQRCFIFAQIRGQHVDICNCCFDYIVSAVYDDNDIMPPMPPTQWHDDDLPERLDQARKAFVTAQLCHRGMPVCSGYRCHICTRNKSQIVIDNVSACKWCIQAASHHVDIFHHKLTLLSSMPIPPDISREILNVFIQLHDLWDNLMIVPYA